MANQHEDLEEVLGASARALRIDRRLTQVELAERANVSVGALKNLESGHGSTTRTLVKVAHALGQDPWLHALAPVMASFNPLDLITPRGSAKRNGRSRVRRAASA
jgi:transcriptional regulator with XRE-family HTH domain